MNFSFQKQSLVKEIFIHMQDKHDKKDEEDDHKAKQEQAESYEKSIISLKQI